MMTTLVIAIVMATIILSVNPRNAALRWLSSALYTSGFMIVVFLLDARHPELPSLLMNTMVFAADIGLAYTLAMFGLYYSDLFDKRMRRRMMVTGLLLASATWLMTPLAPTRRINYEGNNELPVVLFVTITLVFAIIMLLTAAMTEKHPYKRVERGLTNLLMVPTLMSITLGYIFYMFDIDLFRFNYVVAIGFLVLFLAIGTRQGALGVKIKIEMIKANATMKLIQNGSSLLGHTIKNEIGKVDILIHQMRHRLQQPNRAERASDDELADMLRMAADSVQHVQTLVTKINGIAQAVEVRLVRANLLPLVEQCVDQFERLKAGNIVIERHLETVPDVYLDPAHLQEVIHNLLINAAEAMEDGGTVNVSLTVEDRTVVLQIQDTGQGIPPQTLPHIFEPFHSTKNSKYNFGLGLFYCRNVMLQHEGSIAVNSVPGEGTSFYIRFHRPLPLSRS